MRSLKKSRAVGNGEVEKTGTPTSVVTRAANQQRPHMRRREQHGASNISSIRGRCDCVVGVQCGRRDWQV